MTIQRRVHRFILDNAAYLRDPEELTNDLGLVASGIVDSTTMLEVIAFLEAEFGIRIRDDETIPENLESIDRIAAFVDRKLSAREAAHVRPDA
jgi:acyl carrier protein